MQKEQGCGEREKKGKEEVQEKKKEETRSFLRKGAVTVSGNRLYNTTINISMFRKNSPPPCHQDSSYQTIPPPKGKE